MKFKVLRGSFVAHQERRHREDQRIGERGEENERWELPRDVGFGNK